MSRMAKVAVATLLWIQAQVGLAGMTLTITDTQPIIDWPLCRCGKPLPGVLDFALFDFSGQGKLCGLDSIDLTLTMQDGDTGVGDFDRGNLFLGLDGINTGISLDGFTTDQELALSFHANSSQAQWLSDDIVEQLLERLNEDGQLFASIIDLTPGDNEINLYSMFDTSIALTGTVCHDPNPVPEPLSVATWTLLGVSALFYARRRRRVA